MKRVVCNEELRESMKSAINLLCDTVKMTLGPGGSNAIIDHSTLNPYITNDGVTIAENIESDDIVINTILELAKEATAKTNENVGDGTTTTLVLLQSIYNEGMKLIDSGISPILLKRKLDSYLNVTVQKIKSYSRKPSSNELLDIACISANDLEIGKLVYEVYSKIKDKNSIVIKEGEYGTYVKYLKGYVLDTDIASSYFFTNNEIIYNSPYVLLSDSIIYSLNEISSILNYINECNKSLVIVASDYDEHFINEILSLVINNNYKIVLLKNPQYGFKQLNILKDLSCISLASINHSSYNIESLGMVKQIKVGRNFTTLTFEFDNQVKERIDELNNILKLETDEYEKDFYLKSIAMLKNKMAEIIVGAPTKVERREKVMRFDDALCSISSAYNGILVGSGITLYKVSEELDDNLYSNIYKEAIKMPLKQILINAGVSSDVLKKIVDSGYSKLYNVTSCKYENVDSTKVLDSLDVVVNSLVNAVSIAGMLLTTNSLIINENSNKVDYNL
ncbi:MAG: hypothetical protein IJK66_02435 [Bacilli bacterium]|nr:hypothetical protein [Bacilli bacterium]